MAIPFLNNINLSNNELQNAKLHITGTAPAAAAGQIYFDSGDNLAKYYSNGTDTWVSLKEYSFSNGTFINLSTATAAYAKDVIAADLSATGTANNTTYLRGDNTWSPISGISVANFNASAIVTEAEGIENNDNDTTLPTSAAVKAYVDAVAVGGLIYQGGYDAGTNTPNLDTPPTIAGIKKGWTYTVTEEGLFFTEQVRVGDVLIAEVDAPTTLADWTTVQNNIDLASASQIGIGNVAASTAAALAGLSVTYSNGTGTIGLDINGLPYISDMSSLDLTSLEIPLYNNDTTNSNERVNIYELLSLASKTTSDATTITNTAAVSHGLNTRDVNVQLYDTVTYETIFADVTRPTVNTVIVTFATAPTNPIRVLVSKVG